MKIRHAAAFALVGWYLISPPLRNDAGGHVTGVDLTAPPSKWLSWKTFSSQADCEAGKGPLKIYSKVFHANADPAVRFRGDAIDAAKCVATDHPTFEGTQAAPPQAEPE
jgi:hypothetical protein